MLASFLFRKAACMVNQADLLPNPPRYAVIAGITALAIAGALMMAGQAFKIAGSKSLAEVATFIVLIGLYPEPQGRRWSFNSVVAFLLTGVAIGAVWVGFIGVRLANSEASEWTNFPFSLVVLGFINACITAPLFEEKIVRHLLFRGIEDKTNSFLASIIVSIIFAIPHMGSVIWAFFVSMVLCWLTVRWVLNTWQRAIVHGSINLLIMLWSLTSGFGLL